MKLEGSCHCGAVRFTVDCPHPFPYAQCYCSICRKTAGGGGYSINLGGDRATLSVEGEDQVAVYRARRRDPATGAVSESTLRRHFCSNCGSALWAYDPRWPELVHPFASAIDSELPVPPERTHLMVDSKASWVGLRQGPGDKVFPGYPDESLAEWHRRLGLDDDDA